MRQLSNIFGLILLIFLTACQKEVQVVDELGITTYDCYNPYDFQWSDNGIYFIDDFGDTPEVDPLNTEIRIYGFNNSGQFKFKKPIYESELISATDYSKQSIEGYNIETTGVVFGYGEQDSIVDLHFLKLDTETGAELGTTIINFKNTANGFNVRGMYLRENSNGYTCIVYYRNAINNGFLRLYQLDHNLDVIVSNNFNFGPNSIKIVDIEILPNDDISFAYFLSLNSSLTSELYMRKFTSNLTFAWTQNLGSTYSDLEFNPDTPIDLHYINDEIALYTIPTHDVNGEPTLVPTMIYVLPSTGFSANSHFIEDILTAENGEVLSLVNMPYSYLSNNGTLTLCGSVDLNGITTGFSIALNAQNEIIEHFTLSDAPPGSRFLFSGINDNNDYIVSGFTPRFVSSNFVQIGLDDLNLFVSKVDNNGNILP